MTQSAWLRLERERLNDWGSAASGPAATAAQRRLPRSTQFAAGTTLVTRQSTRPLGQRLAGFGRRRALRGMPVAPSASPEAKPRGPLANLRGKHFFSQNRCHPFDHRTTGVYCLITFPLTLHIFPIIMLRFRLLAAILTIPTAACVTPSQAFEPTSPRLSPGIIATPQERAQLRSIPIEQRPNRPLHFYGNSVRRMHQLNAQQGQRVMPSRGAGFYQ